MTVGTAGATSSLLPFRLEVEMAKGKKLRVEIPADLAALAMFRSDRTCCVCRVKGKFVQIHHIDEDPSHNEYGNFAVGCQDCHTLTMVTGGFVRKLDADQIVLYRDDWTSKVAAQRAAHPSRFHESGPGTLQEDVEIATSVAETYREREEYELLAMHYLGLGNDELRDKYIELAIGQGVDDDTLIFFRGVQHRLEAIPNEVVTRRVAELERRNDYFSLGRLYRTLERFSDAVRATCMGAISSIEQGNVFSVAFHLQEMLEDGATDELFRIAMTEAADRKDLWWQYRCLQELGWGSEATQFLLERRTEIEELNDPSFNEELALALGDRERYVAFKKEEARSLSARPEPDTRAPHQSA